MSASWPQLPLNEAARLFRSAIGRIGFAGAVAALIIVTFAVLMPGLARAATFTVDSVADGSDSSPGNGICSSFGGGCTLRAAIEESNARPGVDTINIQGGTYELEIPTLNEDSDSSGDFDIRDSVIIDGAGATGLGATIVDGGFPAEGSPIEQRGLDRLFEIHPTALGVTIRDLTIREGFSDDAGAGIQNWSPGRVRVENARIVDNLASKSGGGINQAEPSDYTCPLCLPLLLPGGRMEIVNTTLSGNAAGGGGAAVNNAGSGTILIDHSDVSDNPGQMIPDPLFVDDPLDPFDRPDLIPAPGVYEPSQPAIDNQAEFDVVGTVHIVDTKVEDNYATHDGAGVSNSGHGIMIIERSQFRRNSSEADGGAIYSSGGTLTIDDTVVASNKAHGGGGIYSDGGSNAIGLRSRVTITDTQISGNDALPFPEPLPPDPGNIVEASGGGMVLDGEAQVTLADINVSGNFAGDGGGGFAAEGQLSLDATRLTVTNNKSHGEGGGIYSDTTRPVVIRDSLVKGNYGGYPEPLGPGDLPPLGTPGGPVFESHNNVAGGGGIYTEGGPVEIQGTTVEDNTATEEGGGISIDNFDKVLIADTTLRGNKAGADGGGVENSGMRTTFDHILVEDNKATIDGGGIYNSSSDEFLVIDSTMRRNTALDGGGFGNAPDADLIIRQSTIMGNVARMPGLDDGGLRLDGGEGGGFWSKADGNALIENTTISNNKAAIGGGGVFHDADGELKFSNVTIWRNSAYQGGGIGIVESDFAPEVPPKANESVILRNTIVGGSLSGGSCDWYVTSEGGNISGGSVPFVSKPGLVTTDVPILPINGCFVHPQPGTSDSQIEGLRDRFGNPRLDELADNGGPTLTNALRRESLAVDNALLPCPETDQRGVPRPQNVKCDSGAYEYSGHAAGRRRRAAGHPVPERTDTGHARDVRVHVHGQRQPDGDRRAHVRVPARRAGAHRGARADPAVGAGAARAPVGTVPEPVERPADR